jgi:hypothetical protein
MAIFQGDLDQLSDMNDDAWLLSDQSGLNLDLVVYDKMLHFGHVSFMMANDMSYMNDIINLIKK